MTTVTQPPDGLIWVGRSYDPFYCGSEGDCTHKSCFVHEAETRGVSRKLPAIPEWAVPGKTRVFLAHRDGHTTSDFGKIFGYFVLHRIEVMQEGDDEPEPGYRMAGAGLERCPDADESKLLTKILARLRRTRRRDRTISRIGDERATPHRWCKSGKARSGWREEDGAVYVVDSLCADITDAWAELRRCAPAPRFERLLERIRKPQRPPRRHDRYPATVRGEFVLFDRPPDWQAFPVASSRSMTRIDGDHLLRQVENGRSKVAVLRWAKPGTRRAVETRLAFACNVNHRLAHDFLGTLLEMGYHTGAVQHHRLVMDDIKEIRDWLRGPDFSSEDLLEEIEPEFEDRAKRMLKELIRS